MIFDLLRLAVTAAGIGLASYGAWLAYPPAGFMLGGAILLVIGLIGSLRSKG